MSSHTVKISLRAAGGSQVAGELGRIGSASQNLSGDVKKLGSVFGETGRQIGDFASSILKGGIFGIIVAVISGIISIYKKWADAAKEAAEAAAKEVRESLDRQKKHITDYMSAVERAAQASKQWISNNLTLRQKEIAATKSLTVATLELEKAQARARGDKAGVQRIEQEIAHTDESAQRNALEAQRKAAFQRMNAARNQVSDMERGIDMQRLLLRNIKAEIAAGENKARESVGSGEDAMPAIREYRKSDEYKELVNRGDAAAKQLRAFQDAQMRAKYEKDQATADLAAAKKAIAAFETRLSAARINTELDEGDKYKVEEKKEIEAIAA
ncbi:MAG: hypothetical protein J6V72_14935, partial [Kiritimatiellae bacterium]|nr:hypothetical protein [Kiritimatiellia bacterium]